MKKQCRTIIFSRNRALQANLLLTSLFRHCNDILDVSDVYILHRNDPEHEESYKTLMSEFPQVNFVAETNFKNDLLALVHESDISWCFFLVDDTIFTKNFTLTEIIGNMTYNIGDTLGFSLRLSPKTNYCFPYNCFQEIPKYEKVSGGVLKYNWQNAEYDFAYPLELSSSLYNKNDVLEILEDCEYNSPNYLETRLAECHVSNKPNLLMFEKGVAFSTPLNLVQRSHPNRNAQHDPDTFRLLYEKGMRIDAGQFDGYMNRGCHEIPDKINFVRKE